MLDQQVKASFKRTLTSLVDVQLQLARARHLNLRVSEEDVKQQIDALKKQNQLADEQFLQLLKTRGLTLETYKKQVYEGLLVTKVVNAEVRSRLTVLDTELQQAYRAKQQQYQVAGGQTVSHILFLFPPYPTSKTNSVCVRRLKRCCSNCVTAESLQLWRGSIPTVPRLRPVGC